MSGQVVNPQRPVSPSDPATEMSMRRTGMSFQRTRMSADRTLMSVIRTSLSLISFGFTIYQVFQKASDHGLLTGAAPARHFGVMLVSLGIAVQVIGIVYHVMFMVGLRKQREAMTAEGLIHGQSAFPPSMTLIAAGLLLLIGIAAIANMVFHVSLFE
jgi:inner membrane protein YidH